ncbi:MAG: hypothetical protein ACFFCI_14605 [Promethearchaeota archaeon]
MIANQVILRRRLHEKRYINGQLAVFLHDEEDRPLAELSIMHNFVELAPNEFILKDYSENEELAKELLESKLIHPTNRFILIGSHLCPICKVAS